MSLMPSKKIWTSEEGVQIEMITYRTILVDRLRDALRQYINKDGSLPDSLSVFILTAAVTTDVILPDGVVPDWAQWLHALIKNPTYRRDPVADYESLVYAPSNMIDRWWEAYHATRDVAHAAPPELQTPEPLKPEPDPETGEVDQAALNFTDSSTLIGETSSNVRLLAVPAPPQVAPRRKAK